MKKVIVGEDSQVERKLIELVLSPHPEYELTLYDNGLGLWQHILSDPPDLVIVDLLLTGLDGFSLCRLLRGHRRLRATVPVLAISSMTTPGTEDSILEHGADAFLAKPFTPEELLSQVDRMSRANSRV